ncbi:DUF5009 domain-containing protein [Pedobacter nyackensis]|uniref:DUF5009 domain-containing protein n=1 Tax=Pedobacter nyackensis TaxID=475255 RepID=UPI0029309BE9|nr:DUF5009 domain-containing protein [Pedobacter nyackensis]
MESVLKKIPHRLVSIDALRAVIMVLMIFVNDLWTLVDIPHWLDHVPAAANGMGLADIVFPAFLFIVGLSVPYAIESRRKKKEDLFQILFHILVRTIALLIMGFFHVNMDSYDESAMLVKPLWQILVTLGFFLVWLDYSSYGLRLSRILKTTGVILLILLGFLFKGNGGEGFAAMRVEWWGILGLIGWGYLVASCVFLFSGGRMLVQIIAFIFFMLFSSANSLGWLDCAGMIRKYIWLSENGAMAALPMAGIITALLYRKFTARNVNFWIGITFFAVLLLLFGYLSNPLWGISKIRATPSWISICAAITIMLFALMIYLTEILNQRKWYSLIKPAGTSTLTCYLLPYIHYALITLLHIPQLPAILRTGGLGLGKSLVYALIIVAITGLLEKRNIRLKI